MLLESTSSKRNSRKKFPLSDNKNAKAALVCTGCCDRGMTDWNPGNKYSD